MTKDKSEKRVKDALGGQHEGKKDSFLLDPDKVVLVDDRGSAIFDERVFGKPDEKFVLNIMALGVLVPIEVRRNPETDAIECVYGRRRVLACREANRRLVAAGSEPRRIPAIVTRGDASALMASMISENEIREADSPMNRARKCAAYIALGHSEAEAAFLYGVSASTIRNMLSLLDAPKDVQRAVERGLVGASDVYKMKGLPAEEQKKLVEKLAADAPKEGKKRRSPGSKATEIVTGKGGAPGKRTIAAKIEELECLAAPTAKAAVATLRWVLGETKKLEASW